MVLPRIKLFWKKRAETSLTSSFSAWFFKKNNPLDMFYYLTNFYCLVAFTLWDLGQYVYCNCLLTRLWCQKLWNDLYFSNQVNFLTWPKYQDKNLRQKVKYHEKEKILRWNKKNISSVFRGLSLKQINQIFFGRSESNFKNIISKII